MVSSADVASHEERFVADTVARVRESASTLGYRPSTAGRTLRRGTSDIVITLVPDMAFSRYFRDLVGELTRRLAGYGYTNLLRLASSGALLEDAVLSLRPFCVVAVAPLPAEQRSRLTRHRVKLIEPTADSVTSTNVAIGRLQAEHLAKVGYRSLVSALPESLAEAVHVLHVDGTRPHLRARQQGLGLRDLEQALASELEFRASVAERDLSATCSSHMRHSRVGSERDADERISVGILAWRRSAE